MHNLILFEIAMLPTLESVITEHIISIQHTICTESHCSVRYKYMPFWSTHYYYIKNTNIKGIYLKYSHNVELCRVEVYVNIYIFVYNSIFKL